MKTMTRSAMTALALLVPIAAQAGSTAPGVIDPVLSRTIDDELLQVIKLAPRGISHATCREQMAKSKSARADVDQIVEGTHRYLSAMMSREEPLGSTEQHYFTIFSAFAQAATAAQSQGRSELLLTPTQAYLLCLSGGYGEGNQVQFQ